MEYVILVSCLFISMAHILRKVAFYVAASNINGEIVLKRYPYNKAALWRGIFFIGKLCTYRKTG